MTVAVILAQGDAVKHGQAALDRVRQAEWPVGNGRQVAEAKIGKKATASSSLGHHQSLAEIEACRPACQGVCM